MSTPGHRAGGATWPRPVRWAVAVTSGLALGAGAALGAGVVSLSDLVASQSAGICTSDPVQAQALRDLTSYVTWLNTHQAAGFIGEVGWPQDRESAWDDLARAWFPAARQAGLPVALWAAGRWPASYPMAAFRASEGSPWLNQQGPAAQVLQDHENDRVWQGVSVASGSFGTRGAERGFSAANPGRFGHQYSYENQGSYAYLAAHGVQFVRLTVVWERIQPRLNHRLSGTEVARIRLALDAAHSAGLAVVLDLHGYGDYTASAPAAGRKAQVYRLGDRHLPTTALAQVWAQLVAAFGQHPAILAWDILNEPVHLGSDQVRGDAIWRRASQQAVDAIRAGGSQHPVVVAGYGTSNARSWGREHREPWIRDRLNRVAYGVHEYFDADGSGRYARSFAQVRATRPYLSEPVCFTVPPVEHQLQVWGTPERRLPSGAGTSSDGGTSNG